MNSLDVLYQEDRIAASIVLETAGNYIISFIATYSDYIVAYLNSITNNDVVVQPWSESRIAKPLGPNRLVSIGKEENEVHWVYFDSSTKELNSYTLKMQKSGGHQFCQSHALRLAFIPAARRVHSNNLEAYEGLITDIWIPVFSNFKVDTNILKEALETGLISETAPYPAASIERAKRFFQRFTHKKLLSIMQSQRAKVVAPAWG